MMFFLFLSLFVQSLIPKQYNQLVEKAIKSSKTKIPKELRQETKFPGIYENTNYRFRLLKTLSNAQTHDIKGFAFDEHNCAIVKRKSFSLTEGYAIVEPDTQGIYLMNNIVAEDGNIIVYNSTKVNIFTIMTEFVLESSTDPTALDLNSLRIKRPKASLNIPFLWDNSKDRPKTMKIGDSDVSFGAGCSLTLGVTTRCSFNNIWDVSISFQFLFEGKFGAELVIPDDCTIEIEGKELFSLKNPIAGLGFSAKFLGLQISLGAFVNFVTEFTDIGINIPIGFDFFKGYMVTATKYFEITPTSISDSKWEITTSSLPSDDSLSKAIKNLLDASFTATLQLRPYLSLEFIIGDISTSLEAGLKFPLVLTVNLDKEKCHFPYLHGNFEIPIKMYFAFTGLVAFDYEIIGGAEKEIDIFTIKLSPFCIGRSRAHEDENEEEKEAYDLIIKTNDIYEKRTNDSPQYLKELYISTIGASNSGSFKYPIMNFPTEENKIKMDRIYIIEKPAENQGIYYSLNYYDENYQSQKSNEYEIEVSELKFNENNEVNINIELKINDNDKSFMNVVIKKVPHISQFGVPFSTNNKTFVVSIPANEDTEHSNLTNYGLYYVDENNIIRHDEETIIYSSFNLDSKNILHTEGLAHIFSTEFTYNGDKKCRLFLDFYIKRKINNQETKIIIRNYITIQFTSDISSFLNREFEFNYEYNPDIEPLLYSGKLVFDDGTEKEIPETKFVFNSFPTRLGTSEINFENIFKILFIYESKNSLLIVESKRKEELPPLLLFLDIQDVFEKEDINENINLTVNYSYTFGTELSQTAFYKTIRIHVSEKYRNSKLYLMHIDFREGTEIAINAEGIVTINKEQVYFDINGKDIIEFTFSRSPMSFPLFEFRLIYCEFDPETLFINQQGSIVNVGAEIPTLMLAPIYYGSMFFLTNDTSKYNSVIRYPCYGDSAKEYYVITFPPYVEPSTLIVKSCVSPVGELEPYVDVDLSNYQDVMNQLGTIYYYIKSDYATDVKCEINGKVFYGKKISTLFQFNYSTKDFDSLNNKLSNAHFSSLCYDDENGVACEIKYPTPERTGFHLIEFPNRDGISITGRGFLRELIPVEAGKSFTYYKSYNDSITFIREYYNDSSIDSSSSLLSSDSKSLAKFNVKLKIDDNRDSKIEGFLRTRTICLYDDDNLIVPFSRKFIEKDFLSFLKILGVSENIDYNYLINDENGCIIFDPKFIDNNDFNSVPKQVCDIYQNVEEGVIDNVDKKNMFFEKGGKDPQQRKKMIIIIVVVVLIVVVVIVLIVVICIIRKRIAKRRNESSNEGNENQNQNENENDI